MTFISDAYTKFMVNTQTKSNQRPSFKLYATVSGLFQRLFSANVETSPKSDYPHIPTMFLTVRIDPEQTIEAMRLGVKGIALKDSDPEVIINGMNTILAGGKWFERGVTEPALQYSVDKPSRSIRSDDLLTKREMEIVELVCLGLRNRQIADRCTLAEGTVKIHLNSVYRKLGVSSRAELIVKREGMRSGHN